MRLVASEEQDLLRDAVRRSARADRGIDAVRGVLETAARPFDAVAWQRTCTGLGLTGLLASEAVGGSGAGLAEASIAVEELAAVLSGAPLLSGTMSVDALAAIDGEPWATLRADLLAGTAVAGVALTPDVADLTMNGSTVSGVLPYVLDGPGAAAVVALVPAGILVVDTGADGVRAEPVPGLDLTRRTARVQLEAAPFTLHPLAHADIRRLVDRRGVLLAADALGLVRAMLDLTADYAKIRVAFGRPIGSFQGVKHQLADLFCTAELARAVVLSAAAESDDDGPESHELALVAKRFVLPAAVHVTTECLRLLGGIGYTWEHNAHLYVRRARVDLALAGPQGAVYGELADLLLLGTPT